MSEFKMTGFLVIVAAFALAASACGSATDGADSVSQMHQELKGATKAPPVDSTSGASNSAKEPKSIGVPAGAPRKATPAEVQQLDAEIAAETAKNKARSAEAQE